MRIGLPRTYSGFVFNVVAEELSGRAVFIGQGVLDDKGCGTFNGARSAVMIKIGCGIAGIDGIHFKWKFPKFIGKNNRVSIQCGFGRPVSRIFHMVIFPFRIAVQGKGS